MMQKQFWKATLGDQYESSSQCYQTQSLSHSFMVVDEEEAADLRSDVNFQKLTELINQQSNE